mmetsp:Transcript_25694/g.31526  ORF Transcript_25694/g.31526 Transcript_25694/m.31526 type:complete len:406 (+) Transcript_25694:118-1335(+)
MGFLKVLCIIVSLQSACSLAVESTGRFVKKIGNTPVPGLKNGMDYVQLGDSDLIVSKVCMGTMTFGEQNTLEEGVLQLDEAFDKYGVNFLDTAEIYPVPTKAETQGRTDEAIRMFLQKRKREDIVLATKVAGRSGISWLPRSEPETPSCLTREQILFSVDKSLERLGTDYIDLLQIHWPDRYNGALFGGADFTPSEYGKDGLTYVSFEEQLAACQELIKAKKVRYIGVSNESAFGVCMMAGLAKQYPELYPKIVSIQNSYSSVVRKDYEAGVAEACFHHKVGLLPYSPLAGGSLSGKYRDGQNLEKSKARLTMFPGYMERYLGSLNEAAVNAYCELAERSNLTPSQLALSWCYHNELVCSTIIGATTMEQLEENIKAYDIKLDKSISEEISQIYKKYTDPTKAKN